MTYRTVGLIYHPQAAAARRLSAHLRESALRDMPAVWTAHTGDEAELARHIARTDLLVCIGGDGTVLWASRAAVPYPIPIISINMGRLGFLSELDPAHAVDGVADVLAGEGVLEDRTMLECRLQGGEGPALEALNDVVIGRGAPGRPVYLSADVDGVHLARIRGDALIIATATGSTAYNLSAGGPVLMPLSRALVLTPVAPHLSHMRPIVLTEDSTIAVTVETEGDAVVSVDGRVDLPVASGEVVVVRRSPHVARFVRLGPPSTFFERLAHHLNLSTRHGEHAE
jgi:NAD+ kinase